METGHIPAESIPGSFDLQTTLESGQTFLWERTETPETGQWFRTVEKTDVIEVKARDGGLDWRSNTDPTDSLRHRLDLDTDLPDIRSGFPNDPVVQAAIDRFDGLRVVTEPVVPTLFSFILSAQMRIDRIHDLVTALRETYGDRIQWQDGDVSAFPDPERLATLSEAELRDLGLGYRAPYVKRTAVLLRDDVVSLETVGSHPYETAREELTEFVGVGPKVADCVLLFGMNFEEPVPLDTWIQSAIETHFPEAEQGSYEATSRAIRERLGPRPGYTQTYLFTHLRTDESNT
ncbi:MAG: DNA-3-methyladenine glycosylase 2 family protein [Halodesulfurarchaeum sp.]|nr:DNA-3-methyladenine glycosylase 2 family protein [Halodesulfurarchaeum sp.]